MYAAQTVDRSVDFVPNFSARRRRLSDIGKRQMANTCSPCFVPQTHERTKSTYKDIISFRKSTKLHQPTPASQPDEVNDKSQPASIPTKLEKEWRSSARNQEIRLVTSWWKLLPGKIEPWWWDFRVRSRSLDGVRRLGRFCGKKGSFRGRWGMRCCVAVLCVHWTSSEMSVLGANFPSKRLRWLVGWMVAV